MTPCSSSYPQDVRANVLPEALGSNVYPADARSKRVRALTAFKGALTDGPTWLPDGAWLAFSSDAGGTADIWVVEVATGEVQQVTRNAEARWPVWVARVER